MAKPEATMAPPDIPAGKRKRHECRYSIDNGL